MHEIKKELDNYRRAVGEMYYLRHAIKENGFYMPEEHIDPKQISKARRKAIKQRLKLLKLIESKINAQDD